MNDRIEQLAEQVDLLGDFIPTKIPGRYAGTIDIATIEKFAELIVRECARVAIEKQTENDMSNVVSKNPARDFACALIEHFGVNE